MSYTKARELLNLTVRKYPGLKSTILDLYEMFLDEVDSGKSPGEEYEKFFSSVKELVNNYHVDNSPQTGEKEEKKQ